MASQASPAYPTHLSQPTQLAQWDLPAQPASQDCPALQALIGEETISSFADQGFEQY